MRCCHGIEATVAWRTGGLVPRDCGMPGPGDRSVAADTALRDARRHPEGIRREVNVEGAAVYLEAAPFLFCAYVRALPPDKITFATHLHSEYIDRRL